MVRRTRIYRLSKIEKKKRIDASEKARLEKAFIRLIGSTKRNRRAKNLLEVAKEISIAEKILGNKKTLAKEIGISVEMLREFTSVNKLSEPVKQMIKDGKLSSVDVAYRLSLLSEVNQLEVVQAYIKNELSGKEVRDIVTLSKRYPKLRIKGIIKKVKETRDIIQYIIRFRTPKKQPEWILRKKFLDLVGKENIISFEVKGQIGILNVSEEGKRILQKEAKKYRITKRKLIELVLEK